MKHLSHGKEVYQQSFDTKIVSKSAGSQAGEVGVVLLVKPACVYFSCAHFFHIITRNPKHREKAQTFLWWNVGIWTSDLRVNEVKKSLEFNKFCAVIEVSTGIRINY